MTDKERKLALYCLKASSDYHSEVCEECINYPNCDHMGHDDVTETIIKVLEQEPTTKNDLGVDCISRADAIHAVSEALKRTFVEYEDIANKVIGKLPSVTPQEPKVGHWIKIKPYPLQMHDYECSECGHETDDNTENYCSDCGAKMVESEG